MLGYDFGFLFSSAKLLCHTVYMLVNLFSFSSPRQGIKESNRSRYFRIAAELSR
jgi:hypothetical protein